MLDYRHMRVPQRFINDVIRPACKNNVAIISAFQSVPREYFVDEAMYLKAYADDAQPIGYGQTISQPSLVAMMLNELEPSSALSCLEIGSGSGFVSALLSKLMKQVYAVEIVPELVRIAQQKLRSMLIWNVQTMMANGALGYDYKAPYDRILVSAGANSMPQSLVDQLAEGGVMIIPINGVLYKAIKNNNELQQKPLAKVAFVDFIHT